MAEKAILIKSKNFAIRIIRMYQWLVNERREYVLSKQCLRSGTSIGANIREGLNSQSKSEFIAKFQISIKEANETLNKAREFTNNNFELLKNHFYLKHIEIFQNVYISY